MYVWYVGWNVATLNVKVEDTGDASACARQQKSVVD